MKPNDLHLSINFFSSSKGKKLKEKYIAPIKEISSKGIIPIHMSMMKLKRAKTEKRNINNTVRKKTNRIYKLHKKDKNRKALEVIKKELEKQILGKYSNPYMKNIHHMISPFSKEKKILYYDYYQINYILDKKRCDLYTKYKDYKLIYDNQEYFFKYFTKKESRVYLNYLLYIIYSKDPFVKSTRTICTNKNLDKVREEYKEFIGKNIFNAKRLILSRDLNKYIPNLPPEIYEATQQKLSRIAIPRYQLLLKPIITKKIKYIYIKDVPNIKIPKIIPNYSKLERRLYLKIKSFIIKKKLSILLINGKTVPKDKNNKKNISKEISRDNNILYSLRENSSDDEDLTSKSNLYISRFYSNFNINFRSKKNKDITDIESLIFRLQQKEEKEKSEEDGDNKILPSNLDSLNTVIENEDSEVFLSSLKKPFIGNRDEKQLKHVMFDERKGTEIINKIKDEDLLLYTINFLRSNKQENKNKKKFNLYLDLNEDENNFYGDKNTNLIYNEQRNIVKKYFNERFIDPKKYKEYLIKSPFIKNIYKISDSFSPKLDSNKNKIYNLISNNSKENSKNINSFSSGKNNQKSFKATYKFLLGFNKKEKRDELITDLVNKSNKICGQIKTMVEAEKMRSNFKKSGPFAFTSFERIYFGQDENEWDINKNYFKLHYNDTFGNSSIFRKINKENIKKEDFFKRCTTLNDIIKTSNVYL